MNRTMIGLLLGTMSLGIATGCTVYETPPPDAQVVAAPASPPPQVEVVPVAPYPGAVWVGGVWVRSGYHNWYWRRGYWRRY